jgi:hypothetical protein
MVMRRRRESPPATHDDDRRASRGYFDTPGGGDRSDGDDNRRRSRRPPEIDDEGYDYHQPLVRWVLDHADLLTPWEEGFCVSLISFAELSEKQWGTLRPIADKVEFGSRVVRNRRNRR